MIKVGYAAARGDPACGVSNAIAGAQSAIWIAMLNLKKAKGKRARAVYVALDAAFSEMASVQSELLEAVVPDCIARLSRRCRSSCACSSSLPRTHHLLTPLLT
jgi:hypothetical protein